MKKVLIISPYFPPTNAADMQRIRMSLPFFKDFGWEAEIVTIDLRYSDMATDDLLNKSVPENIPIHYVKAFSKKWTSKVGLGSIALRSLWFYKKKVNRLLLQNHFDLIYFSTTQYPVCILGSYWKKKFNVPYVIDMQDPWHSDYYKNKPKAERPPKYWLAYQLNKVLEPIAMKKVDGLIAVSEPYLKILADRYTNCRQIPKRTITFGAFDMDFTIAKDNVALQPSVLPKQSHNINITYVGRGGGDMQHAVTYLFEAFKKGLSNKPDLFKRIRFYFIGTSYAASGKGIPTILPVANILGVEHYVSEITDRIPFYQTLNTLADATALFVPGSNDPQYTASKIYPYVLAKKPLLAIFHPQSSVVSFLRCCKVGTVITFDLQKDEIIERIENFLLNLGNENNKITVPDCEILEKYSARTMTQEQCSLFDEIIKLPVLGSPIVSN